MDEPWEKCPSWLDFETLVAAVEVNPTIMVKELIEHFVKEAMIVITVAYVYYTCIS